MCKLEVSHSQNAVQTKERFWSSHLTPRNTAGLSAKSLIVAPQGGTGNFFPVAEATIY